MRMGLSQGVNYIEGGNQGSIGKFIASGASDSKILDATAETGAA